HALSLPDRRRKHSMSASRRSDWCLKPIGDRCLIVAFESRVDPAINERVRAVADYLLAHPIEGVIDVVPAFTTVASHYRPEAFCTADRGESPYLRRWPFTST